MKDAKLKKEIEQLYIIDGMSIEELFKRFKDKVSRKTLYNWIEEGKWKQRREKLIRLQYSTREKLLLIYNAALDHAIKSPNKDNLDNVAFIKSIVDLKEEIKRANPPKKVDVDPEASITIKKFAEIIAPQDFKRTYEKVRRRAHRNWYITYSVSEHSGFIKLNDPAITPSERRSLISYLSKYDK